jgi:hypothetical protein
MRTKDNPDSAPNDKGRRVSPALSPSPPLSPVIFMRSGLFAVGKMSDSSELFKSDDVAGNVAEVVSSSSSSS